MAEAPFDEKRAHRWFAVELNNLAWDLLEAGPDTPADTERMIHAAHGACFHWLEVGDVLNHLRAQCLLACVYTAAGLGDAAVRHAERCLALSEEAGDAQTAFDRATAHGCAAGAYACVGRRDEARDHHRQAQTAAAAFDDAGETEVFERLFPVPQ